MYQLILGDCLEKMEDIPEQSVDFILCDLPYGTTKCKWDTIIPFESLWEHYNRILNQIAWLLYLDLNPSVHL